MKWKILGLLIVIVINVSIAQLFINKITATDSIIRTIETRMVEDLREHNLIDSSFQLYLHNTIPILLESRQFATTIYDEERLKYQHKLDTSLQIMTNDSLIHIFVQE